MHIYYFKHCCECVQKIQHRGMLRNKMQYDKKMNAVFISKHTPNAVFSIHKSKGGALSDIFYLSCYRAIIIILFQ